MQEGQHQRRDAFLTHAAFAQGGTNQLEGLLGQLKNIAGGSDMMEAGIEGGLLPSMIGSNISAVLENSFQVATLSCFSAIASRLVSSRLVSSLVSSRLTSRVICACIVRMCIVSQPS